MQARLGEVPTQVRCTRVQNTCMGFAWVPASQNTGNICRGWWLDDSVIRVILYAIIVTPETTEEQEKVLKKQPVLRILGIPRAVVIALCLD